MEDKQKLEEQKTELINDLITTTTVIEELWRYHPDNPNKVDIIKEFKVLTKIKTDIEKEIQEIDIK